MKRFRERGATAKPPARLLRLHRHSLSNLLVLGGTEGQRLEIARAFHDSGPLRGGSFHHADCAHDQGLLACALQRWLIPGAAPPGRAPLQGAEGGTLYLDAVECLPPATQGLLLLLARRLQGDEGYCVSGPVRLAVGSGEDLDAAVEGRRFSAPLLDCLDKIRVDLGHAARQGVA